MTSETLLKRLAEIVGPEAVTTDPAALDRYSADALDRIRAFAAASQMEQQPQVVVSPSSTEQVAALVRLANEVGLPVVPYGAGTGVMGAAVPVRGGMVLNLGRMDRVLEISGEDRTAVVQAGVVLEGLERRLAEHDLMLGHDPWSVPIATVAGAICTNGVGCRASRYGSMGEQVLGLEVVLPTGQVVRTRPVPKAVGPALKDLFVGSEGVFGVITEATLRVFPQPEERRFRTFAFDRFERGFAAVQELARLGLRPAVLDLSEEPARHSRWANADNMEVTLTLVFEGCAEEVAAQESRTLAVCLAAGAQDRGCQEAEQEWRFRHQMAHRYKERLMGRSGSYRRDHGWGRLLDYLHVALPPSRVVEFYRWSKELLAQRGLQLYEAAVWTAPELFSLLIGDPREQEEAARDNLARTVDDILTRAQEVGGSMEYCHGAGIKLAHLLGREWGVGAEMMRRIKDALDPNRIMNPGKLGL